MRKIRVLPAEIVNRIAAGEVIERPASVVKEVLENALDAHATEITVVLEEGGAKRIQIRDNGHGIAKDDLPLVFHSHATSKLDEDELAHNYLGISSLGFRGEALASMAAVAMVDLTSRVPGTGHAYRYRPDSDEPEPAAGEPGTVVEIANLFYNTPARRKFLRAASTELSHCLQQCSRLALAYPGVSFRVFHGQRSLLELPAVDCLEDRVRRLVPRKIIDGLLRVESDSDADEPAVQGFIGGPQVHRRDTREQHFFVNGRWVRDRTLTHALRSAYQGFHIPGYQPVAYLFLDFPAADVDANVHPTKTEVRFRDQSSVYRLVHHAVRRTLEGLQVEGDGAEEVQPSEKKSGFTMQELFAELTSDSSQPPPAASRSRSSFLPMDRWSSETTGASPARISSSPGSVTEERSVVDSTAKAQGVASSATDASGSNLGSSERGASDVSGDAVAVATKKHVIQVFDTYLAVDSDEGLVLIDQHALHEKILYEEIYRRLVDGVVESQRLLVPEVVTVPRELLPLVEKAAELLGRFGFEVEPFGADSIACHAIPAIFDREAGQTDLESMFLALLEDLRSGVVTEPKEAEEAGELPESVDGQLRAIASMMACKRAIKAGSALSPPEIQSLLARGSVADDPRHCPHGRPAAVVLARREMEKLFDRK